MSAVAHHNPLPVAVTRHLSTEEYQADLCARGIRAIQQALRRRRVFVERYPLLAAWLAAPLPERVGHLLGEPLERMTCRVAYEARPYLYCLVRQGGLRLDYAWLLAIQRTKVCGVLAGTPLAADLDRLKHEAIGLGYDAARVDEPLRWAVGRLFLHTGKGRVEALTLADIEELRAAIVTFGARADLTAYYRSAATWDSVRREALGSVHVLWVVLYHRGQIAEEPRWHRRPAASPPPPPPPLLTATVARYLAQRRAAGCRPRTVTRLDQALRRFIAWLVAERPCVMSFADVTREDVLTYAQGLDTAVAATTGRALAPQTKHHLLSALAVFFRQTAHWGWAEVPGRPLLLASDLPRLPLRVPRYIPEDQLAQLMMAIRALPCPYRRAALLVARWSGARRDEIRRLPVDCLDHYPDGTPRLHLPVGKSRAERVVPLTEEAAEAIRALQALRPAGDRGLRDDYTGAVTRYLFVHHGQLYSASYLFESALAEACRAAGLVDGADKPTVTAHRFRHTVGTQLAERGRACTPS
jgi:integrase